MANKRIKGITIEIGGDTTKLEKAISGAEKAMKQSGQELGEIDRALKKNPQSIELWKQKQKALNESLAASKEKLKVLTDAQTQMQEKMKIGEISEEQYRAFQRELISTRTDVENLQRAADSCSPALESLAARGESLQSAGESISGAGEKMLGVTAAIAAAGAAAVSTAANFDEAMSKVGSISGASATDLEMLREKAKEMGETTKFSATEAASAFEYMAMAGWKTSDMLSGIEGIMNLAAASGEELATTSDIVTDAITAFGMTASDSAHFADVLAAASSNANTNVSMMGETFKYVAPVAGTLGYSVDDVAVAIGLMANAGTKASDAGTSLRKGLLNLSAPAKAARTEMEKLGFYTEETITSFDEQDIEKQMLAVESATLAASKAQSSYNSTVEKYGEGSEEAEQSSMALSIANEKLRISTEKLEALQSGEVQTIYGYNQALQNEDGTMKSFSETIEFLRDKMSGLTETEQMQAAAHIFGTNAASGMLSVVNASTEDYEKLTSAIRDCDGTAENMASVMQDNLNGQLTILKSQLESVAISFGEILMPTIRELVSKIQSLVEKFKNLDPFTQQVIVLIASIVAAIGPLLIVVGKIITLIGTIMTWLPKLKAGIAAVNIVLNANPIGVVILSITALVGAFIYLWNHCEWFRNGWLEFIDLLKTTFINLKDKINEMVMKIIGFFTGMYSNIKEKVEGIKQIFTLIISYVKGTFLSGWKSAWEGIKSVFTNVWESLENIAKAPLNGIISLINAVISGVNLMISGINSISFEIPEWVPKVGGKSFGINIPEMSSIPYLAKGGVVSNGGTAVVGEAGAELLQVLNGRAVVTPLTSGSGSAGAKSYNITNIVNVDSISSDYDVDRLSERLARKQEQKLAGVGGY